MWDGVLFVNHGYYVEDTNYNDNNLPSVISTLTGINAQRHYTSDIDGYYILSGMRYDMKNHFQKEYTSTKEENT